MEQNRMNTVTNRNNMPGAAQDQIDLLELGALLLFNAYKIIAAAVVGALLFGAYTFFHITPLYQATSTIYVYMGDSVTSILSGFTLGTQIINDFQYLAKTRPVLNQVIDDLKLNTTAESLKRTIAIANPGESRILTVTVTNADPALAAEIANDFANVLSDRIALVMNTERPFVAEEAIVNTNAVSPNLPRNVAIGGVLGGALVAGLLSLLYLLDDTVKSRDDVERRLGLETFAEIPVEFTGEKGKKSKKSKKGGKRGGYYPSRGSHIAEEPAEHSSESARDMAAKEDDLTVELPGEQG